MAQVAQNIQRQEPFDFHHIQTSEDVMGHLKSQLDKILAEIPKGSRVAYLDIPVYLNVGDLLINWGTDTFLKDHGIEVSVRLNCDDYVRFIHQIGPNDVILLQGGGNMNDIWHRHENMRQDILKKFPGNKIIVLPQTIHFRNKEEGRRLLKNYEAHGNCIIFVRDKPSYDFVTQNSAVRCELCPDMAHALWRSSANIVPEYTGSGTLLFKRDDLEANDNSAILKGVDWRDMISKKDRIIYRALFAAIKYNPFFFIQKGLMKLWHAHRDHIIQEAITQFKVYRVVKTDRLHGMIMGTLLGKQVKYDDNNYGKLSGYTSAWLKQVSRL